MSDSPIMRFFSYKHLPEGGPRDMSKRFAMLAAEVEAMSTEAPAEKAVALRKLLEAKDAAVRAALPVVLVLLAFLWPAVALAETLPAPESTQPTALGSILTWVALAVLGLIVALVGAFGVFLQGRAKESKAWAIVNSLWVLMQTAVAHAERELRPQIQKALADGKLSPEEAMALKAKTLEIFKGMASSRIDELAKLLRLGDTGIGVFLSGLLERAVGAMKVGGPPAVPAPGAPVAKPDGFFGDARRGEGNQPNEALTPRSP